MSQKTHHHVVCTVMTHLQLTHTAASCCITHKSIILDFILKLPVKPVSLLLITRESRHSLLPLVEPECLLHRLSWEQKVSEPLVSELPGFANFLPEEAHFTQILTRYLCSVAASPEIGNRRGCCRKAGKHRFSLLEMLCL